MLYTVGMDNITTHQEQETPEYMQYPEGPPTKNNQFPPVRVEDALYIRANMEADRRKWSLSTLIREAVAFWLAEQDD